MYDRVIHRFGKADHDVTMSCFTQRQGSGYLIYQISYLAYTSGIGLQREGYNLAFIQSEEGRGRQCGSVSFDKKLGAAVRNTTAAYQRSLRTTYRWHPQSTQVFNTACTYLV